MKKLAWSILLSLSVHAVVFLFPDSRQERRELETFPVVLLVEEPTPQRTDRPPVPTTPHLDQAKPETLEKVTLAADPELPSSALLRSVGEFSTEEQVQRAARISLADTVVPEAQEPAEPIMRERFTGSKPERPSPEPGAVRVAVVTKATEENASPVSSPRVKAAYAFTPAPDYPPEAKSEKWEGQVLLRVFVNTEGLPEKVEVSKSSGFFVLDSAAVRGARRWKFHPAREEGEPVATWVKIPMRFNLKSTGK